MTKLKINFFTVLVPILVLSCQDAPKGSPPPPENQKKMAAIAVVSETVKVSTTPKRIQPPLEKRMQDAGLIDITKLDSSFFVELKYSTTDNFLGMDVYGDLNKCYLQLFAAQKLVMAHKMLKNDFPHLRYKILDGARPLKAQQIFWDSINKPENIKHLYVAKPEIGSIHNFGCAVDVTLADTTGKELDLGTPFDYFGYKAYPSKEQEMLKDGALTIQHIKNREILREYMFLAGFTGTSTEWWHFNATSRANAKKRFKIIE